MAGGNFSIDYIVAETGKVSLLSPAAIMGSILARSSSIKKASFS